MINEEKRAQVETSMKGDRTARPALGSLTESELRMLRAEIETMLPSASLSAMDLPGELMAQFQKVKDLQDLVLFDEETPVNQKAQLAGQVVSTMQQLIKMQTDFYTSERFRSIENMLIAYVKKMPLDLATAFIAEYEQMDDRNG